MKNIIKYVGTSLGYVVGGLMVGMFVFWIFCLNHIGRGEVGIVYNPTDGSISQQNEAGWHRTPPLTRVCIIPTLPIVVDIQDMGPYRVNYATLY